MDHPVLSLFFLLFSHPSHFFPFLFSLVPFLSLSSFASRVSTCLSRPFRQLAGSSWSSRWLLSPPIIPSSSTSIRRPSVFFFFFFFSFCLLFPRGESRVLKEIVPTGSSDTGKNERPSSSPPPGRFTFPRFSRCPVLLEPFQPPRRFVKMGPNLRCLLMSLSARDNSRTIQAPIAASILRFRTAVSFVF